MYGEYKQTNHAYSEYKQKNHAYGEYKQTNHAYVECKQTTHAYVGYKQKNMNKEDTTDMNMVDSVTSKKIMHMVEWWIQSNKSSIRWIQGSTVNHEYSG